MEVKALYIAAIDFVEAPRTIHQIILRLPSLNLCNPRTTSQGFSPFFSKYIHNESKWIEKPPLWTIISKLRKGATELKIEVNADKLQDKTLEFYAVILCSYAAQPACRYSCAATAGSFALIIPRPTIIMSLPLSPITCIWQSWIL